MYYYMYCYYCLEKGRVALKYNLQAVKKVLSIEAKGDGEEVCMRRLFCSLKYI